MQIDKQAGIQHLLLVALYYIEQEQADHLLPRMPQEQAQSRLLQQAVTTYISVLHWKHLEVWYQDENLSERVHHKVAVF